MANYYNLSGPATRILWYPEGRGGPIVAGGPAPGPVLVYSSGSLDVSVSGDGLTISRTPVGTLVTAIVKAPLPIAGAPGATGFAVLIPEVQVAGGQVAVRTIGVLSVNRGGSINAPGQIETYTEMPLHGHAANIILPL